ncbi:MAG: efflux RND transporter periplasmic adaptor subunit [Chromatiales bacterium]|jgi:membrane fusion protein (multidrug efflux system)
MSASSRNTTIILVALVVIVAAGGYYFWQQAQQPAGGPKGPPPSTVSSTEVATEQWQPVLTSVGSLVAVNGIDVSSEVNGIVSEIAFESGQEVQKDQVLIRLDDSIDIAALEALQADQALAKVQFNRVKGLFEKSVTSKSEFDEAEARFDAARARVRQQEAVIKRKIIRAPFPGLAGIRKVDIGEFIEVGDAIVSLQQLDPIYVDYTLPERYLARIKKGQAVTASFDAVPDKTFSGTVSAVDSGIDIGTQTLKVRATLDNAEGLLRPGMFAQVETVTGEARPVLTLPRTAISFNTYGNVVYVINRGEEDALTVKRTPVKTGEVREGRVAVENLETGTEVVRTGLVKLRDGAAIKIDNSVALDDAEITGE